MKTDLQTTRYKLTSQIHFSKVSSTSGSFSSLPALPAEISGILKLHKAMISFWISARSNFFFYIWLLILLNHLR